MPDISLRIQQADRGRIGIVLIQPAGNDVIDGIRQRFAGRAGQLVFEVGNQPAIDDRHLGAGRMQRAGLETGDESGGGSQRIGHVDHQLLEERRAGAGGDASGNFDHGGLNPVLLAAAAQHGDAESQIVGQFLQQAHFVGADVGHFGREQGENPIAALRIVQRQHH